MNCDHIDDNKSKKDNKLKLMNQMYDNINLNLSEIIKDINRDKRYDKNNKIESKKQINPNQYYNNSSTYT